MIRLINILERQYGINCINITAQEGGWSALAYKVSDGVKDYFLKVHLELLGMGTSSLLCGLLPAEMVWFWVFTALCTLLGASSNLYNIPYIAYMQETIAPERMGRAFSLIGSLSSATMSLGLLIAAPIAENRGVSLWFFVSGIVLLLLTLVSALLVLPQKDNKRVQVKNIILQEANKDEL